MPTWSYWHRTLASLPDLETDFALVGGGIAGLATAYWLRKSHPKARILVIDAHQIAAGASGRNAGFLLQGTSCDYATECATIHRDKAKRLWQFTKDNLEWCLAYLDGNQFELRQNGSYVAAGDDREAFALVRSTALLVEDGFKAVWHPPQEANARMGSHDLKGALFFPDHATVHSAKLLNHIFTQANAEYLPDTPILALEPTSDGVMLTGRNRRIKAQRVLLAMNAYLPELLPETQPWIRPVRAQMLATQPIPHTRIPAPVYSHEGFFYVRQETDGRILLGGARHLHEAAEVGYEDIVTPMLQEDLETYLRQYFTQDRPYQVWARWSGTMGFSPDHLPCIGTWSASPHVWWVGGFSGHGMGFGFRMGKLLADALSDGQAEDLDLFDVKRFGANIA